MRKQSHFALLQKIMKISFSVINKKKINFIIIKNVSLELLTFQLRNSLRITYKFSYNLMNQLFKIKNLKTLIVKSYPIRCAKKF